MSNAKFRVYDFYFVTTFFFCLFVLIESKKKEKKKLQALKIKSKLTKETQHTLSKILFFLTRFFKNVTATYLIEKRKKLVL